MHTKRDWLRETLTSRIERIDRHLAGLVLLEKRFAWLRLAEVVAGGILTFLGFNIGINWLGWTILVLSAGIFGLTAFRHNRLVKRMQTWNVLRSYVRTQVARLNLDWASIPIPVSDQVQEPHPFERDLNLVGDRSLHQLLDVTTSAGGSARLRHWLLNLDPDREAVLQRQAFVQELLPLTGFRSSLALLGAQVFGDRAEKFDGEQLLAWLGRKDVRNPLGRLLILLGAFSALNITLFVMNALSLLPPVWIPALALYGLIYQYNYKKFESVFSDASQLEGALKKFRAVLEFLESYRYPKNSLLAALCKPFTEPGQRPSRDLRGVSRVVSAASLKYNPPFWLFLNLLVPWDLIFAYRLEQLKRSIREKLPGWLEVWYELEALHSLANFAFLNPDYAFPEIFDGHEFKTAVFTAQSLGHPLIDPAVRVTNRFQVREIGEVALITGSNMSGKSTFLRTVGINLCLAFAGAPAAAESLQTIPFRLFSCINVSDSLANGISYFYAEVRQLKYLLVELERDLPTPVFFLIDEIFRGTNNRERQIGSRAYVRALTGSRGTGLISTHDLELVTLADEMKGIDLYHFEEIVMEDRMVFDYKLHPGPSKTTNALKIMEMEGLPVGNA